MSQEHLIHPLKKQWEHSREDTQPEYCGPVRGSVHLSTLLSSPVTLLNFLWIHLLTTSQTTQNYFPISAYPSHPKISHFHSLLSVSLNFPAYSTYGPATVHHHPSDYFDTPIILTYITYQFLLAWLLFLDCLDLKFGASELLRNVSNYLPINMTSYPQILLTSYQQTIYTDQSPYYTRNFSVKMCNTSWTKLERGAKIAWLIQ
jgi:hypothetical protein